MATTAAVATVPTADEPDLTGQGRGQEATRRYERSPRDVLHLLAYLAVSVVLVAIGRWAADSVLGAEQDLVRFVSFLSAPTERVLAGLLSLAAGVVVVLAWILPVITRRYRLFGYIVLANVGTALVVWAVDQWLDRDPSRIVLNVVAERAGTDASAAVSIGAVAQITALFTVLSPFVSRRWRRAGAVTLAAIVVVRLVVSVDLPLNLFIALPLGATVGTAVLCVLGRPDRRPTVRAIRAALVDAGLDVAELHPAQVDARGSTPYFATLADGSGLFVKVLGDEERSADLLFRLYRSLRLKDVGDDRPFSNLRRTIEHEALVSLQARDLGLRTPRMRGVVDVGADSMLLAYDLVDGRSLDGLAPEEVDDDLLRASWALVADLRQHRIAHRDLRRSNLFVADDGRPWLIDFGFSELAASDALLDADVAQLLASFAVVAGADRTVATAVEVLGRDVVASALPRLQLPALSGATRTALKQHKGLLDELRAAVMDACGIEEVQYAKLERVNRHSLLLLGTLTLAVYFLFPQLADVPRIVDQIGSADWAWLPLILVLSAATYVAATVSLFGAVPDRLPAGPTMAAQVGSSFATKLAPAGVGGMALNVRFLQKQGIDEPVAVSGVGLNTLAGMLSHVALMAVFVVWAGPKAFDSFHLPSPETLLLGLAAIVVLAVLTLALRRTRRLLRERLVPVLRRAGGGLRAVLRQPGHMALLFGGSLLLTLCYLGCVYLCMLSFGGGLSFATVGAVYLAGAAAATAAPTPGGLGAFEAAVIAGLVAAGLPNYVAVPTVFLFRLATYWLPILPGLVSFRWLERHQYL